DDHVLDADAADARLIEPGLHGDHLAGLQGLDTALADGRGLVDVDAHAMAGRVDETVGRPGPGRPVAIFLKMVSYQVVDEFSRDTRLNGFQRDVLGLEHDVVHPLDFRGRLAFYDR